MYSEEGERLEEEADLEVELRNVHFSYPSRKRVQVCPLHSLLLLLFPESIRTLTLCFPGCASGAVWGVVKSGYGPDGGSGGAQWVWQEHCHGSAAQDVRCHSGTGVRNLFQKCTKFCELYLCRC